MNEYRRFVQNEIDRRGWSQADVERNGGPTRQVINSILKDDRPELVSRPKQETVEKLAKAFDTSVDVVLAHVAMAMGLPVTIEAASLENVSDDDLLDQIRKRMQRGSSQHADDTQPDVESNVTEFKRPDGYAEDAGSEQKTEPLLPDDLDIAAHPNHPLQADHVDEHFDQLGEESQDPQ